MGYFLQIKLILRSIVVAIPVILTLIGLFCALSATYVYTDAARCDKPGWPSCYKVGYSDGQNNPGSSCPKGHSTEFCRGWDDGSGADVGTVTSTSSNNSACVQLSGDIRNVSDQQHFCL